jgi:hypothetical protein
MGQRLVRSGLAPISPGGGSCGVLLNPTGLALAHRAQQPAWPYWTCRTYPDQRDRKESRRARVAGPIGPAGPVGPQEPAGVGVAVHRGRSDQRTSGRDWSSPDQPDRKARRRARVQDLRSTRTRPKRSPLRSSSSSSTPARQRHSGGGTVDPDLVGDP